MQAPSPTFRTLATTRNEAAIDVLLAALDCTDEDARGAALDALTERPEPRATRHLIENWSKLTPQDIGRLRARKGRLTAAITAALTPGSNLTASAIEAAKSLSAISAIGDLVTLAESHASRAIRRQAGDAVLSLVATMGCEARLDRAHATVRNPVLVRLVDSLQRFSMHRNETLVEAFLAASTWGDGDLRNMIAQDGPELKRICECFTKSSNAGVIGLLAGFIRRKHLPAKFLAIIQTRSDASFRDALLRCVGSEPSGNVIRNLRDLGMPKSCQAIADRVSEVDAEFRAALIHLYAAANQNNLETINLIVAIVRQGGPGCVAAAIIALSRCEVPDGDFWMRAAIPVADDDQEAIASDENAKLLNDLIGLLDHAEPALVRSVQRLLAPLHADAMLRRFHALRLRSRRRIGRVVMMIDPGAVQRVRDALRHPVLAHRLEAIAMAEALAIVDLLSDSFTRIARDDHQEARIKAANVMADAESDETLGLLQEMIRLPESPVRDAAVAALLRRETNRTQ